MELPIVLKCKECGDKLNTSYSTYTDHSLNGQDRVEVEVEPCDKCLGREYDEGFDKGYDKGEKDGDSAERL